MGALTAAVKDRFSALDTASPLSPAETRWDAFRRLARVIGDDPNLEFLLSRAKTASEFLPDADSKLEALLLEEAEKVIRSAVNFIVPGTDLSVHEVFLRRIARRTARRSRIKLFTTNYDLCFETAARRAGFIVVDGFAFGADAIFQSDQFSFDVVRRVEGEERSDYIENLFHLYKLHGSVDWEMDELTGRIVKRPNSEKPILIYPRSTKYEMAFSQPYVEMMGNFQASLRNSNTTLLVLGFGFNDKHIVEPIISAARSNLSFNVIVVDPGIVAKSSREHELHNEYVSTLLNFIDNGDGRLALVEAKFEEIVPFIPDLMAETDLERHLGRVRNSGGSDVKTTS